MAKLTHTAVVAMRKANPNISMVSLVAERIQQVIRRSYKPEHKRVLFQIAYYHQWTKGSASPSLALLTRQTSTPTNKLLAVIADFERDGVLRIVRAHREFNRYSFVLPELTDEQAGYVVDVDRTEVPKEMRHVSNF